MDKRAVLQQVQFRACVVELAKNKLNITQVRRCFVHVLLGVFCILNTFPHVRYKSQEHVVYTMNFISLKIAVHLNV